MKIVKTLVFCLVIYLRLSIENTHSFKLTNINLNKQHQEKDNLDIIVNKNQFLSLNVNRNPEMNLQTLSTDNIQPPTFSRAIIDRTKLSILSLYFLFPIYIHMSVFISFIIYRSNIL